MELRNKEDSHIYTISSEDDGCGGFMIMATPRMPFDGKIRRFCMHYQTLQEFCDEWEDVD